MKKRLGLLPPATERRLVIGVSMHRTGTRSLASYLRSLGHKDLHWPWWCEQQISRHLDDHERIVKILEPLLYHYDCFLDVPFPGLYRELDRRFPNSRFILVRRDPTRWWRSVYRHWDLDAAPHRLDPFEELVYRQYDPTGMVRVTKDDAEALMSKALKHSEEVQAFFHNSAGKLLVVDLETEDLNVRISRFLGAQVQPYPHELSTEGF